ncbi:MAG: hypothetical protein ACO1SX_21900 [Actinomycetota bacterium]
MNSPLELVLSRLDNPKRNGDGWKARCPAHDDAEPSLCVGDGDKGVVLQCKAGCPTSAVVASINLKMSDLFHQNGKSESRPPRPTLHELAADKRLPVPFLRELGLHDLPNGGVGIPYRDADGLVHATKNRVALKAKEGSFWEKGKKLFAYGVDRLERARALKRLVVVEGESDCWTLWHSDFPALGIPGADAVRQTLAPEYLEGIERIDVIREPDKGGQKFAKSVAERILFLRLSIPVYVIDLDGAKDPNELHQRNPDDFRAAFRKAVEQAPLWAPENDPTPTESRESHAKTSSSERAGDGEKSTQSTRIVESFLASGAELFCTPDGESFVAFPVAESSRAPEHFETHALRSKSVRGWIARQYYQETGKAPSAQPMQDAFMVLDGEARYNREQRPVFTRIAPAPDGGILLDLGDAHWQAVHIGPDGWRVVPTPDVSFRRAEGLLPLPVPARGGSVERLAGFLNVDPDELPLLVGYLVGCYNPRGPYACLEIRGEQGSAKSTAARLIRSLIDPNKAALRVEPRDPRDLAIAANNGWVIGYDNLSHMQPWLSDALCRLSTGGGFGVRKHYSDDEEALFDAQRPALWTGITEIAHRSDLVDRTIFLTLPTIPDYKRRTERDFWEAFEAERPAILGALLDAVSMALRNRDQIRPEQLPRMADFAVWVMAAEPALPWEAGTFLTAYNGNRKDANAGVLESSPIASLILPLAERSDQWGNEVGWEGTSAELLACLEGEALDEVRKAKSWPKTATALSSVLRRLSPNLRAEGVAVEFGKTNGKRWIRVSRGGTQGGTQEGRTGTQGGTHCEPGTFDFSHDRDARDALDAPLCLHSSLLSISAENGVGSEYGDQKEQVGESASLASLRPFDDDDDQTAWYRT